MTLQDYIKEEKQIEKVAITPNHAEHLKLELLSRAVKQLLPLAPPEHD